MTTSQEKIEKKIEAFKEQTKPQVGDMIYCNHAFCENFLRQALESISQESEQRGREEIEEEIAVIQEGIDACKEDCKDALTLDRIDGKKGYSKKNCRWATRKEQSHNLKNNVFVDCDSIRVCAQECSRILKVHVSTIFFRI